MATVVQLEDGVYEGAVNRRGKPNGFGTKRYFNDGMAITCEWVDGVRAGGPYTIRYANGDVLKGDDSRNVVMKYANRDEYIGEYDELPNGKGEMNYDNGDFYRGTWEDGEKKDGVMNVTDEEGEFTRYRIQDGMVVGEISFAEGERLWNFSGRKRSRCKTSMINGQKWLRNKKGRFCKKSKRAKSRAKKSRRSRM